MRLAILGSPTSWYVRDLARAAGGKHTLSVVTFRDLAARVSSDAGRCVAGEVDLAREDAVLVRTMPPGSLEQVIFRMDVLGRLEAGGCVVLNPPRAVEAAVDKYLTTARLQAAGLPVPRTAVCQTADEALREYAALGGDVVVKPLFGSEGRGITRLNDEALAERAFRMLEQLGAVIYLQEFIDHEGSDLRLLVIGEETLGMRRRNPHDWRTNVSRGATAEAFSPDEQQVDLARRAAAAVGAPLAGVDVLVDRAGNPFVIEVNAVPGWQALSRATGVDVAARVLTLVNAMVAERAGR